MQKHARDVVRTRLQTIELDVEHVGHPGQRMPVCCISGCHCPGQPAPRHAHVDRGICGHVQTVVDRHEVEVSHRPIYKDDEGDKDRGHESSLLCGVRV